MGTPIGTVYIEDEDTDNELRYFLIEVTDSLTRQVSYGYDVYSNKNEFVERVGYKNGSYITEQDTVGNGDIKRGTNMVQKQKLSLLLDRMKEGE